MRKYKVILICDDTDNPNGVDHHTEHTKDISEEGFNTIYKLII